MSAFDEMAARASDVAYVIFGDPAVYAPAAGTPFPVTVLFGVADNKDESGFRTSAGARNPSANIQVRVAEVPNPSSRGDTITVKGKTYKIRGRDPVAGGLDWALVVDGPLP